MAEARVEDGHSESDPLKEERTELVDQFWRFPWKKGVTWLAVGGLLYLLRDFFTLIILTFVTSYIGNSLVTWGLRFTSRRRLLTVGVFLSFLLLATGMVLVPLGPALDQGRQWLEQAKQWVPERIDGSAGAEERFEQTLRNTFGPHADAVTRFLDLPGVREQLDRFLAEAAQFTATAVGALLTGIWYAVFNILVALLLSFIIVWDIPKIRETMGRLATSRIGGVYREVAPGIAAFGTLLGRTLQAQTVIALVNTALTSVGLAILGVQGIGFLSLIVFVCSFIPILGFILSTIPIILVASNQGGLALAAWIVGLVAAIHAIEGYVLNPQIYGASLKLHPLAVLVVLITFKQFFGIWGLVLGVPIAVYVWHHLILGADWNTPPYREAAEPPAGPAPLQESP